MTSPLLTTTTTTCIHVRPTIGQLLSLASSLNNNDSSATCPICQRTFRNRGSKHFHMAKTHNVEVATINALLGLKEGAYAPGTPIQFHCPFDGCANVKSGRKGCYKDAKLLMQHFQKTHLEKRHECDDCSAKFALPRDLRYHRKKTCSNRPKMDYSRMTNGEAIPQQNWVLPTTSTVPTAKQNVGIQTDAWLIPTKIIVVPYRKIQPKKTIPTKKSISIQTDDVEQQFVLSHGMSSSTYFYGQCDPSIARMAHEEGIDGTTNAVYHHHHYEDSYAQTSQQIFTAAQQMDFGAQFSSGNSSSAIYLNPIQMAASSTQTQPMHMFDGGVNGLLFEEQSNIRHFGTQTPPVQCSRQHFEWNPTTTMAAMSTVAAQTEENDNIVNID